MKELFTTIAPLILGTAVGVFSFWLSRDRSKRTVVADRSLDSLLSPELSRAIDEVVVDVNESPERADTWLVEPAEEADKALLDKLSVDVAMAQHQIPNRLRRSNPELTMEQQLKILDDMRAILEKQLEDIRAREASLSNSDNAPK